MYNLARVSLCSDVLCTADRLLATTLASTHWMLVVLSLPAQPPKCDNQKIQPHITKYLLGAKPTSVENHALAECKILVKTEYLLVLVEN